MIVDVWTLLPLMFTYVCRRYMMATIEDSFQHHDDSFTTFWPAVIASLALVISSGDAWSLYCACKYVSQSFTSIKAKISLPPYKLLLKLGHGVLDL